MTDIPKPEISPAFTLEDIRKLRDWNYERWKRMSPEEFRESNRRSAEQFLAQMAAPIDQKKVAEFKRRMEAARDGTLREYLEKSKGQ